METSKKKVLALKYRPQSLKEVIGQPVLVSTLTNFIKSNRIPNSLLLVGSRGSGKTSTARIWAKAICCTGNFLESVKCKEKFCHCEEITNDKHLDIIEYNAANSTGVDSIREIIESGKYKPTTAKYKIYIVDECHMLSSSSWNALLKTLEEPPETLRFVMCTTEPKKVPLTIKSRCTQFTLHRAPIKVLFDHLKKISKIENGKISDDALMLLSKAAAGSIRDAISLLETALLSNNIENKEVDTTMVRKMLGIADKSKLLNLLNFIFKGEQEKSLASLREMVNEGLEPTNFLNDLLEIVYLMQQKKNIGNLNTDLSISETEQEIINSISNTVSTSTLIIFWQIILKVLNEEMPIISSPILSLEMLVVRLVHLKGMPSYEDVLESLKKNNFDEIDKSENITFESDKKKEIKSEENQINKISKNQIKNITQAKPILSDLKPNKTKEKVLSFEDLIYLSSKKKEIHLKYDLENNVNLIKFSEGKIDISFNENLDKNFVRNLSKKLLEWTNTQWVISLSKEKGQKTFTELQSGKSEELLSQEKKGEIYKKFKNIFSDGELLKVKKED